MNDQTTVSRVVYDYTPHDGPQVFAHGVHVDELLYGGAAGGGKSRWARAELVLACLRVPGLAAIIFRRTFPDLNRSVVGPLLMEIPQALGRYNRSEHKWYFHNGSTLELGHLQTAKDLDKYQGAELQLVCVERSTPILMGDGKTWKQIQHMQVGDYVATLEGPKRVTKVHDVGMKPAAHITTAHGSAVTSTNHKLLTANGWAAPAALMPTQCRDAVEPGASLSESCQCDATLPSCSLAGQRPAGEQPRPRHQDIDRPATLACREGHQSCSEASDDSPRAAEPLLQWSGQLVLYGQPHGHAASEAPSCGVEDGQAPAGVQGYLGGYPACSRCDDGHDHQAVTVDARPCPHIQAGAAAHSRVCSRLDDPASTPRYNREGKLSYAHPYKTGRVVVATEDAHHGHARMAPAGEAYMFDLTVDGANHYVSFGQIITRNCFEEATHFTKKQFDYLKSRLRAAGKVKTEMERLGLRPRMILTANPGGVGHHWVKKRFVDPAPLGGVIFKSKPTRGVPNPPTRCYVPAKVTDNPSVDGGYIDKLDALPDNLRRALRDGDWNVLDGVRFTAWSNQVHVIEPAQLPIPHFGYPRAIGIDYGSSAPFAALWGAKLSDNLVVVYRELYKPGLTPRQQAELIRDSEMPDERMPDRPISMVLDPSMWARPVNNPLAVASGDAPPPGSIADAYYQIFGSSVGKARNERVGGWALVDEQLRVRDDGLPRLLIHSTCVNLIRTLPALPRDKRNPDDVDTTAEDHAPDALRYLLQELIGKQGPGKFDAHAWDAGRRASRTVTGDLSKARL